MKKFFAILISFAVLFLSAPATSQISTVSTNAGVSPVSPFSRMVFFGDSLTDSGFFRNVGQQPSFTTNPDPVWSQIFAQHYGLEADPAYVLAPTGQWEWLGGTNYAVSGARVSMQGDYTPPFVPTATAQVDAHIKASYGVLDPNGLYVVWAGANDVLANTQQNASGLLDPATHAETVRKIIRLSEKEAGNVLGLLSKLQQAGAGTVMVVNLPNLGSTPQAMLPGLPGLPALWTQASLAFNRVLAKGLNELNGNVVMFDTFSLLNEMIADPVTYGLENITDAACTSLNPAGMLSSAYCTRGSLVEDNAHTTYMFADGVHPTGTTHGFVAKRAIELVSR